MGKESQKALKLFEKAKDAFNRNSFDYALSLLMSTITLSPDFVQARHLKHLIAKKKLESGKLIPLMRVIGNATSIANYILGLFYFAKKDYAAAMLQFEHILTKDPVNIIVFKLLGECAEQQEMLETAIDMYETIRVLVPSDIKNLKKLGDIYKEEAGDLDKARECYGAILQYDKKNQPARKGLSDVAALGTIEKGSYDDMSSSFLTKVKDLDYNQKTEKKMRAVKSQEDLLVIIHDLEDQHKLEPKNVKIILELAHYHLQAKLYDQSVSWYREAQKLAPEDYTITKHILTAETTKIDDAITALRQDQSAQPQQDIAELEKLRTTTVVKYMQHMVAERPNDRELRFQLGRVLFDVGCVDEAIKQFQIAVNEPRFKLQASNYLGLCFSCQQMFDLAEIQFNTALKELSTSGQIDSFTKDVLYNLATVYEKTGQIDKAIDTYKEIYKVDIGFKDVSQKIRQTYKQ